MKIYKIVPTSIAYRLWSGGSSDSVVCRGNRMEGTRRITVKDGEFSGGVSKNTTSVRKKTCHKTFLLLFTLRLLEYINI